jgi:hypothetical protein
MTRAEAPELPIGSESARAPVDRLGLLVVTVVVVSVFGPYVRQGVRTEQLAIYGLLAVLLPFRLFTIRPSKYALRFAVTWLIYVIAGAVGLIFPAAPSLYWTSGSAFAGMDGLLLPLAVMALVWCVATMATGQRLLLRACRLIAVFAAANGVLAIVMTRIDLAYLIRIFWAAEGGETVWESAAQQGRISGIFNQPAEAGLAYGIAALAACYAWRKRPGVLYGVLVPIMIGGLLSVSKVFVVGAMPLVLWQVWQSRSGSGKIAAALVGIGTFLTVAQSGFAREWVGFDFLGRLFRPGDKGLVNLYTAGRIGGESTHMSDVIADVSGTDPLLGAGASGLRIAYDNGFLEAFVVAGLIGVACYSLSLVWICLLASTDDDQERRRFLFLLMALSTGASLGITALTANRASTLLWLILALAVLAVTEDKVGADPIGRRGAVSTR